MPSPTSPPFLTASVAGTGGQIKAQDEDFRVDEIAAYEPSGDGDHIIVKIRKRGIATYEAIKRISRALDIKDADIGSAGLKDARAVTTQQLSLPPPVSLEAALALEVDGVEVLAAARHPHKLRTGHLHGNMFTIVIRDCDVEEDVAAARASEVLMHLGKTPGSPNWFGEQRFGGRGDNAESGRALLMGEYKGRKPKPRVLRLLLSSIQSEMFNDYLLARIEGGTYRAVISGDILKKTDSGGVFETEDPEVDSARFEAGAVVGTGPMFGPKMVSPSPGTAAAELEDAILGRRSLPKDAFVRYRKLMPGTRRPLSIALGGIAVKPIEKRAIEVSFSLPSGSYATSVLREITKPPSPAS